MAEFGAGEEGGELHAGVIRNVLLKRVPVILRKEVYATDALLYACIQMLGGALDWSRVWLPWLAILVYFPLRMLSLRYGWHLSLSVAQHG